MSGQDWHRPSDGQWSETPAAKIPGVGWTLPRGAKTSRGGLINVDAHPLGRASYAEAANPIKYPPHRMKERWPEWDRGYEGEHPPAHQTEVLVTLWRARRIPGMSPADHDRYVGVPTAEEINDLYALADTHPHKRAILKAWMELSAPPVDPKPDPVPDPPPAGPVAPPAPVGLRPLSPATVRVLELLSALRRANVTFPSWLGAGVPMEFAVEALRFYRLIRAKMGDTRPLPSEDRP